jgi:hypothetical protein
MQVSFLSGLKSIGEIRALFAAEVPCPPLTGFDSCSEVTHRIPVQLLLRSETRYYSQGSIIADSREDARGLLVITSGQVLVIQR